VVRESDELKKLGDSATSDVPWDLVQVRVEMEEFPRSQPMVEAEVFWQKADLAASPWIPQRLAENVSLAGSWRNESQHHLHCGSLAGAIGPEKSEDLSALDGQSEILDGGLVVEILS
jgi:hypothetical protein